MQRKLLPLLPLLSLLSILPLFATALHAAIDPDRLAGLKARAIGPAGMSGRVTSIAAVEANPDVVYIGAAAGGVWKSLDGGLSFAPIFDDQPVASIGALAVFQPNPDIVWAGTGEGNIRNSVSIGNGIYRSLDGGKTWTRLGLEKTERIYRIVLHPSDPNVAWVSALGQAWGENPDRGVFKTTDGGKSWRKVLYVDERTGAADLVIDPRNPDKLFASMWQYRRWPWFFKSGGPGSGLYLSWDGGESWKEITDQDGLPKGELGRIGLAISHSHPEVVYAMVEAKKSALLRSDDGGRSWKTVNDRFDVNPRPFYFCDIRVDPELPNRLYSLDFDLRVSDDGGKTFSSLPGAGTIHGDYHALWIDPRHPDLFYFSNDGGVAVSRDRGKTAAFVSTLPLAQFYHVAVDMERPYNVYGGLQDNGSWRGPSDSWQGSGIRSEQWRFVGGGDGFDTRPDLADPNLVYSMSQGGELQRFDLRTGEVRGLKPAAPEGVKLRFNWNAGLAQDPFDPATIYYGSQFVHKSTDRGESWTTISPDLTSNNPAWQKQAESGGLTLDVSNAENHTTIIAIAPSPAERGVIWTGSDDGRLHVTRDGGKSWTSVERNVPGVPANTWIPHVLASRAAGGTAFVVFDNHRREDFNPYVARTDDYGKSWKSLATPDLRGYALSIEQDPVDKDLLFLGTELGLWVSFDGGAKWLPWRHGVPTASVMDLVLHPRDNDLVIGTHGRALFVLDDVRPLREISDQTLAEPLHLYGIADAQQHGYDAEPGGFGTGAGEFRGEGRAYGALLTFSLTGKELPLPDDKKEHERKLAERQAQRKAAAALPVVAAAAKEDKPIPPKEEKGEKAEVKGEKPASADKPPSAGKPSASEKPPAGEASAVGEKPSVGEKPLSGDNPASGEKPPEVEIRIADATGKTIRTFTAPAKLGVNRVAWDLRRDGAKPFPSEREPDLHPAGWEAGPGTYTATVKYADHEASGPLRVVPDPRSRWSEADWQRRDEALRRVDALFNALAEAASRIRKTRADVDAVLAKQEKPEKKAPAAKPSPLAEQAGKLKESLSKVERRIWVPFDTPGLVSGEGSAANEAFEAAGQVGSSFAPPSPNNLEHLKAAERVATAALAELNRLYDTEVADFRKAVDAAGLRLLPEVKPLELKP
jgi:photosystem II stability/assembly factor-like uncharacterized protein